MKSGLRTQRIEGIVLRRFPVGENDLIYSVFTRQSGRIRSSARGALKAKNRWRGVLEPFNCITADISAASGGSLHRFMDASVHYRPKHFLENLSALHAAYVVLECLDKYTADDSQNMPIYDLSLETFRLMDDNPDLAPLFVRVFCLLFLTWSGFGFQWQQCIRCGKDRPRERSAYCLPEDGGVICGSCISSDKAQKERIVSRSSLNLAMALIAGEAVDMLQLAPDVVQRFNSDMNPIISGMFAYHLGDLPKSLSLVF